MRDLRRGARQTAYQVLVASSPEKLAADQGDLWDSGRVATDQSTQVVYAGAAAAVSDALPLEGADLGRRRQADPPLSRPAFWSMGLLTPADVQAQWIGLEGPHDLSGAADRASLPR